MGLLYSLVHKALGPRNLLEHMFLHSHPSGACGRKHHPADERFRLDVGHVPAEMGHITNKQDS